jgi:hypothetical protein
MQACCSELYAWTIDVHFCKAVGWKYMCFDTPFCLQTPAPTSLPPVPFAAQLQQLLATLGTGRPITYKNVEVKSTE